MHDNIVYRELMYFSKSLWIFSYICLEWEDFEIDLVVLLGMKIYGSIVRYLWYDTDGHYEPRNDCGNLFLAASESTKQLQFSANGKYTVIYNIYIYVLVLWLSWLSPMLHLNNISYFSWYFKSVRHKLAFFFSCRFCFDYCTLKNTLFP